MAVGVSSPAYGELSHYYLEFKRPKIDRRKLWGVPTSHEDVYQVFVRFLNGQCFSPLTTTTAPRLYQPQPQQSMACACVHL
jgi:hypothetical protein